MGHRVSITKDTWNVAGGGDGATARFNFTRWPHINQNWPLALLLLGLDCLADLLIVDLHNLTRLGLWKSGHGHSVQKGPGCPWEKPPHSPELGRGPDKY